MARVILATDAYWVEAGVRAALSEPDFTVVVAHNARELLDTLECDHPDLVILDLQIEKMGAPAIIQSVVESAELAVPILLLLDREADIWLARRFGADAYLQKPVGAAQLLRIASALTEQSDRKATGTPIASA